VEDKVEAGQTPEEELQEVEAALPLYRSLGKHQGWALLVNLVRTQAQNRLNTLITSLGGRAEGQNIDGMTAVLKDEFDKGVRAGMLLVLDTPRAMIEHYGERVVELQDQLSTEDGEEDDG